MFGKHWGGTVVKWFARRPPSRLAGSRPSFETCFARIRGVSWKVYPPLPLVSSSTPNVVWPVTWCYRNHQTLDGEGLTVLGGLGGRIQRLLMRFLGLREVYHGAIRLSFSSKPTDISRLSYLIVLNLPLGKVSILECISAAEAASSTSLSEAPILPYCMLYLAHTQKNCGLKGGRRGWVIRALSLRGTSTWTKTKWYLQGTGDIIYKNIFLM